MDAIGSARLAERIPADRAVGTTISRESVLAALREEEPSEMLLDVVRDVDGTSEDGRISITWSRDELEALLALGTDERLHLTFDGDELAAAFADVEAHGLRERAALISVAAAAGFAAAGGVAAAMPDPAGTGPVGAPAASDVTRAPASAAAQERTQTLSAEATSALGARGEAMARASEQQAAENALGARGEAMARAYDQQAAENALGARGEAMARAYEQAAAGSRVTDVSSGGGYAAPAAAASAADATVTDVSSGGGYAAPAAASAASSADRVTDVSSGGYPPAEPVAVDSGGSSFDVPASAAGGIAGGIALTIAAAAFATRRRGSAPRPV